MDYRTLSKEFLAAKGSVFAIENGGEKVYVKQRRPGKNPIGRAAQAVLHRLTANPLLVPPPGPIGDNVSFEAETLRRLGEAGVRVPRVLWQAADYFVMSHAGDNIEISIRAAPDQARAILDKSMLALRDLHDRGFAHGGAIAKNFTLRDGEIHFIDFDDYIPAERLESFQLRDVFLFLNSMETLGFDPDLAAWCALYDGAGPAGKGTLARLRDAILGIRVVKAMDLRCLDFLSMRDIRVLVRMIRKAEKL